MHSGVQAGAHFHEQGGGGTGTCTCYTMRSSLPVVMQKGRMPASITLFLQLRVVMGACKPGG